MAAPVVMEINQVDIKNLLKLLDHNLVRKAIRSALDRTATWSKNYSADLVAQNYNVKSSDVRKVQKVKRSTQTNLSASFTTSGRSLSLLDNFKATQDAVGISATIGPGWIERKPHAFINVPSGSRKVIKAPKRSKYLYKMSKGKAVIMKRVGSARYPTTGKPGWGPPVQALLERSRTFKGAQIKMFDHLYKELEKQIANRTKRIAPVAEIE